MNPSRVAKRYARALVQMSKSNSGTAKLALDIAKICRELANEKKLFTILTSPVMPIAIKRELVDAAIPNDFRDATITALIEELTKAERLNLFAEIFIAFDDLWSAEQGIETAEVFSAIALSDSQTSSLIEALKASRKAKEFRIKKTVVPNQLGGLVIKIGDKLVDLSLQQRLEDIAASVLRS
jgi:F-type H+-transporting ATPase subunit delta